MKVCDFIKILKKFPPNCQVYILSNSGGDDKLISVNFLDYSEDNKIGFFQDDDKKEKRLIIS